MMDGLSHVMEEPNVIRANVACKHTRTTASGASVKDLNDIAGIICSRAFNIYHPPFVLV
jgi:hypothetical protein